MQARPPICASCTRFTIWDDEHETAYCAAFPEGIPQDIFEGFDHRKPHNGDHGIRYEADPKKSALLTLYETMVPPPATVTPVELKMGKFTKRDWTEWDLEHPYVPVAHEAVESTKATGGATVSTHGQSVPNTGLAYSPNHDTEQTISANVTEEEATKAITEYIKQNSSNLAEDNNFLGVWQDNGKIFMDVSKVGPDEPATVEAAMNASQLAVHDMATGEDIPVGTRDDNGNYSKLYENAEDHPHFQGSK